MVKRVLKAVCMILMVAVLLLNLFTMILRGFGLSEQLNWLPGALLAVESGSMEPVLYEGDLLLVWETPYEELRVGDIITFHKDNELVTHRIVRQEGELFVPQGIANDVEDAPIGRMEYCAKVIGRIPRGGVVLDLLTNPIGLSVLLLFVLVTFFGVPAMKRVFAGADQSAVQPVRVGMIRVLAAGTMVSLCCVVPFLTSSKYIAEINDYGFARAGETYFSSNYLTVEEEEHTVKGWGGKGYGLTLELRNYANDLLRSKDAVSYELVVEIVAAEGEENFETGYSLEISDSNLNQLGIATPASPFRRNFTLSGSDSLENVLPKTQFQIEVIVPEEADKQLNAKDKIQFKIQARTTNKSDFNQVLKGKFTFEVAEAGSFLGEQELTESAGTSLVIYNIKTELADDMLDRRVEISWPSQKVYLNRHDSYLASIIAREDSEYYEGNGVDDRGYLRMSLRAYSNLTLQFFKYNPNDRVDEDDITCDDITRTEVQATGNQTG